MSQSLSLRFDLPLGVYNYMQLVDQRLAESNPSPSLETRDDTMTDTQDSGVLMPPPPARTPGATSGINRFAQLIQSIEGRAIRKDVDPDEDDEQYDQKDPFIDDADDFNDNVAVESIWGEFFVHSGKEIELTEDAPAPSTPSSVKKQSASSKKADKEEVTNLDVITAMGKLRRRAEQIIPAGVKPNRIPEELSPQLVELACVCFDVYESIPSKIVTEVSAFLPFGKPSIKGKMELLRLQHREKTLEQELSASVESVKQHVSDATPEQVSSPDYFSPSLKRLLIDAIQKRQDWAVAITERLRYEHTKSGSKEEFVAVKATAKGICKQLAMLWPNKLMDSKTIYKLYSKHGGHEKRKRSKKSSKDEPSTPKKKQAVSVAPSESHDDDGDEDGGDEPMSDTPVARPVSDSSIPISTTTTTGVMGGGPISKSITGPPSARVNVPSPAMPALDDGRDFVEDSIVVSDSDDEEGDNGEQEIAVVVKQPPPRPPPLTTSFADSRGPIPVPMRSAIQHQPPQQQQRPILPPVHSIITQVHHTGRMLTLDDDDDEEDEQV